MWHCRRKWAICTLYLYQNISVLQQTHPKNLVRKCSIHMSAEASILSPILNGCDVFFYVFWNSVQKTFPIQMAMLYNITYNVQTVMCCFSGINSKSTSNTCTVRYTDSMVTSGTTDGIHLFQLIMQIMETEDRWLYRTYGMVMSSTKMQVLCTRNDNVTLCTVQVTT